ncbi:MAG: protein-L-isoaspartate(D-aspartate) O-methyltransferase [Candidatus Krumholzibacteria bacterium]|nr:protein-L-isoaspartate(D-aspartate) O-methyltransferase [Candidatus Krumholzibacteria bacterium]
MVRTQIISRGVVDQRVIKAMNKVPRELMVSVEDRSISFQDGPLSIGCGQTISQPYIVAYMTEQLQLTGTDRVLEIGTGSGYQTAVLAEIVSEVYTVEIIDELSQRARVVLMDLGYDNIRFRTGDGSEGWPEEAPFDAIMVTASPPSIPDALRRQLVDGGRLIVPAGVTFQYLFKIIRKGDTFEEDQLIGVRFVPMTGRIQEGES